ncbi:hypothetical protein [Hydrogenovibrio sp. SC-1]|nr:hypothetical protein [Hydrogenovibrio sp. SC-1]
MIMTPLIWGMLVLVAFVITVDFYHKFKNRSKRRQQKKTKD